MKRSPSRLLADGYAMVLTTGLTAVLGLVYWAIAARLHDPETFGTAAAIISAGQLLATWGLVNLPPTVLRFLPRAGRAASRQLGRAYGLGASVSAAGALVFALLCAAGHFGHTGEALTHSWLTTLAFIVATAGWAVFYLQDIAMLAAGGSRWLPVENVAFGLVKLVLLVALRHTGVAGMVISWFLPALLATIPVNSYLFTRLLRSEQLLAREPDYEPSDPPRFLLVGLAGYAANAALTTAMPLVVAAVGGSRTAGFFAAAWTIGSVIDLAILSFPAALLVAGSRDRRELHSSIRTTARHLGVLVLAAVTGLFVTAPVLLSFYGPEYAAAGIGLLRWFAIGLVFRACRAVLGTVAYVERAIGWVSASDVVAASLLLAGIVVLVPAMGVAGAGIAYTVANLVALFVLAPAGLQRSLPAMASVAVR